ncbi:hypothetical protein [Aeoliella mucimassa]|uniref:hypothetical protein n=1 Tax=Aeoliella mucimassa TaxID=2527972 RepID=UPI0011A4056A|nr:hypothetical protein [Aeoliella mucimassa]
MPANNLKVAGAGFEQTDSFPQKEASPDQRNVKYDAVDFRKTDTDQQLVQLLQIWQTLPEGIRHGIMAIIAASSSNEQQTVSHQT